MEDSMLIPPGTGGGWVTLQGDLPSQKSNITVHLVIKTWRNLGIMSQNSKGRPWVHGNKNKVKGQQLQWPNTHPLALHLWKPGVVTRTFLAQRMSSHMSQDPYFSPLSMSLGEVVLVANSNTDMKVYSGALTESRIYEARWGNVSGFH